LIDNGLENIQVMQISGDITEVIFSQYYRSGIHVSDDLGRVKAAKKSRRLDDCS
jgi:hypothetical protein